MMQVMERGASTLETLFAGCTILHTNDRVPRVEPHLRTRFRWRAYRRRAELEAAREVPFYRWEVQQAAGRWEVVAMQNLALPTNQRRA